MCVCVGFFYWWEGGEVPTPNTNELYINYILCFKLFPDFQNIVLEKYMFAVKLIKTLNFLNSEPSDYFPYNMTH